MPHAVVAEALFPFSHRRGFVAVINIAGNSALGRFLNAHWPGPQEPDVAVPPAVQRWALGPGESAVLAWCLHLRGLGRGIGAVLDDARARKAAQALGLRRIGTAGILMLAKAHGRIAAVKPPLDAAIRAGLYLSPTRRETILRSVGEQP